LLLTLEKFGAVPQDRIIVQCTDRVPEDVRNGLIRNGYTVIVISPYLDGKYCNKLRQLDYFLDAPPADVDGIFLLDIDMAIVSPLDVSDRQVIWGKIVDASNPPITILEKIFAKAAIDMPGVMPCDWGSGDTVATNFNGGFYYIPLKLALALLTGWRKWAEFLFIRPELFEHEA